MVNVLRLVWKNLHRAEKIYTGSARGARDNYEVCIYYIYNIFHIFIISTTISLGWRSMPRSLPFPHRNCPLLPFEGALNLTLDITFKI